MDLNGALVFVKVVEAQGFSAAGRLLAMPKTTVSKKISDLEAELGLRLLIRTTRSLSLTDAGARVYAHYVAAFRHMDAAQREAQAAQSDPEGPITIAAPGAIGVPFLLPAITAFLERHPLVQVNLLSVNERPDLDKGLIDVMIWAGPSMPAGHAVRLVASVGIGLYASAAYVKRYGTPLTTEALAEHKAVVVNPSVSGPARFAWRLQNNGLVVDVTPSMTPRFRSNDPIAVLSAVAAGHGIGALPARLVDRVLEGRSLIRILPDWQIGPIELSALCRDASSLKVRLFVNFLTDWFRRL